MKAFSFSEIDWETSLLYYLPIAEVEEKQWFHAFRNNKNVKWKAINLVQFLNSERKYACVE